MAKEKKGVVHPCRLGALAAAWVLLASLPIHALANGCQIDRTLSGNYTGDKGPDYATSNLAPKLITLDKSTPPGTVIFDHALPPVPYVCESSGVTNQPFLSAGTSLSSVLRELQKVGLKLVIQMRNLPAWEPSGNTTDDRFRLTDVHYTKKSPTDATATASGILYGNLQLVVVTPPSRPIRAYFPAYKELVKMNPDFLSSNSIMIGSLDDTAINLIPKCIAKISTPGSVHLGQAYSVGHLPLPPKVNFTLYADFDESCDGGFKIVDLGSLAVPLKVMFQPEDNLELAPFDQGIVLKGNDGQPNGFTLELKESGVYPITFNAWRNAPTLSMGKRPVPLYYSAQLTKSGAPLIPGEFSQKVTVLVTYQ